MTYEELKDEAKRQGYALIKKRENIKLLPCTCGRKRIERWYVADRDGWGTYYKCDKCGKQGDAAKSILQAKINWNNAEWRQSNEK